MTKQEKIEKKLAEYKERFNGKDLLSPAEIAPIIRRSTGVQANMRKSNTFPLPIINIGRLVYVRIEDLAELAATDKYQKKEELDDEVLNEPSNTIQTDLKPKKPKVNSKHKYDHHLGFMMAWKNSVTFQFELIAEIEKIMIDEKIAYERHELEGALSELPKPIGGTRRPGP